MGLIFHNLLHKALMGGGGHLTALCTKKDSNWWWEAPNIIRNSLANVQSGKKEKEREGLLEGLLTDSSQNSLIPFAGEARGQIPRWEINLQESPDRISNSPVPWHAGCFQTRRRRPRAWVSPPHCTQSGQADTCPQEQTTLTATPAQGLQTYLLNGLDLPFEGILLLH